MQTDFVIWIIASSHSGPSRRLQGHDKTNVKWATKYHSGDIFGTNGWPKNTEVKDTLIGEALSEANAEATKNKISTTDMTQYIRNKVSFLLNYLYEYSTELTLQLRHVSSNIRGALKATAEDVVPGVYHLLPSAEEQKSMTPQEQVEFTKQRVAFLRENLACFDEGHDDKVCHIKDIIISTQAYHPRQGR